MTVKQVAAEEQVSERQAQRYCREGYQGHILPAMKVGKNFRIEESDYRAWRIACGFDVVQKIPQVSSAPVPAAESAEVPTPCATFFPPWPMAADPNGELTTAPSEHSRNWPHPSAVEAHRADEIRKQQIRLRGYPNE